MYGESLIRSGPEDLLIGDNVLPVMAVFVIGLALIKGIVNF